jgi:SdrD B-like domain
VLPQVWVSGSLDGEERTDGSRPVAFRLSRTNPSDPASAPAMAVSFGLSGTATPGTDYTTPDSYTATFAPGQLTTLVTLGVLTDDLNEEFETTALTVLPSSAYTVVSGSQTGWADIFDTVTTLPTRGSSSVSGTVWLDSLPNSTQDPFGTSGDAPLADVRVNLFDGSGGLLLSTFTDANGHYSFTRLPAGIYSVEVQGDTLRLFVTKDVGSEATDSDVGADGRSDPFDLDGTTSSALQVGAGSKKQTLPTSVIGVKILHAGEFPMQLKVAKWEQAFVVDKTDPNTLALVAPDKDGNDFIDRDPDKFYVCVIDTSIPVDQPISATIATTHTNPSKAEYQDAPTTLTLLPVVGQPGAFISDSQILVSNEVDDKYSQPAAANPNWAIGGIGNAGGIGADDQPPSANNTINTKKINGQVYQFPVSDRTHIVALGGEVVVGYANAPQPATYSVPVKKTVKLHVNILNVPKVGGGTEPAVANAVVETDIKKAREIYAQIGVDVQFSNLPIQVTTTPDVWRLPPNGPEIVDPPDGAGLDEPAGKPSMKARTVQGVLAEAKMYYELTDEEKAILGAKNHRTVTSNGMNDVEVYYVQRILGEVSALSYSRDYLSTFNDEKKKYVDSVVMSRQYTIMSNINAGTFVEINPPYLTLAHEVAHILDPERNTTSFTTIDTSHFPYKITKEKDVEKTKPAGSGERTNLLCAGGTWIYDGWGYKITAEGIAVIEGRKPVVLITGSGIFDSRRLTRAQDVGYWKEEISAEKKILVWVNGMKTGHTDLLHGG